MTIYLYSPGMGTNQLGEWGNDINPSWTDETLPLHVRQVLLERALDQIKANRVQGANRPGNQGRPHHPGQSGSEASGHGE